MNPKKEKQCLIAAYCILVFAVLFIILLGVSLSLNNYSNLLFHFSLFFTGWFAWTFLEYLAHRYLMHQKHNEKQLLDFKHTHHHTHPTDIQISAFQRCVLLSGCTVLMALSIWFNNYFTIAAGFLCGFAGYTIMHFLLHKKMMQTFLKKMVNYHIYHHCKYPDKCFGISATWWDDLLGTAPPNKGFISQKVIDFYFKKEKTSLQKTSLQGLKTNKNYCKILHY